MEQFFTAGRWYDRRHTRPPRATEIDTRLSIGLLTYSGWQLPLDLLPHPTPACPPVLILNPSSVCSTTSDLTHPQPKGKSYYHPDGRCDVCELHTSVPESINTWQVAEHTPSPARREARQYTLPQQAHLWYHRSTSRRRSRRRTALMRLEPVQRENSEKGPRRSPSLP